MSHILDDLPDLVWTSPNDWSFCEYTALHVPSGIRFWTANGFLHFGVERPFKVSIPLRIRWRLWRAIKRLKQEKLILELSKTGVAK